MDSDNTDKARKERSPSFPFISLKKALDRATAMAAAHKRSSTRPSAVGETWGYSPSSSGLTQTVAALKAYGLLDDVGKGEDRRVQLSELAFKIMNDARPGAKEAATQDAALRPKLFAEYTETWLPDRPSDAHCISELTLDRGFTTDAAKLFLRVFDDNSSFANLTNSDKLKDFSPPTRDELPKVAATVRHEEEHPSPAKRSDVDSAHRSEMPASAPYRVTFTGSAIEIAATVHDAAEADALVNAINALKVLLPQKA